MLLRRLYNLVFIHRDTRLVRIAGITANPVAAWVTQQARNLSMELAEQANAVKFLIRDRDAKFTASYDAIFAAEGTRIIVTLSVPRTSSTACVLDFDGWARSREHPPMTLSFLYRAFCRVLQFIRLLGRSDADLAIEVVMLRHEVAVLRRQVQRPALASADRAVLAGLARLLPRRRLGRFFVQPATLLRWHRDLVAKRWTYPHGRPGRPSIANRTTALVLRLAKENPTWGYRRIHGELATMGITIAPSSVWAILKRHGIDPSPRRSGPTWAEFLAAQAEGLMACDFFHVDTVLLRRLYVLIFIHHDSRLVRIAGVTATPVADWVTQCARNLSMQLADKAHAVTFLIRDHDTKFTASFDAVFAAEGARIVKTPVGAPRANAICERVIGSIRRECLDRMLILGRRHLEAVVAEYIEHYNSHRPRRSLSQRSPAALDSLPAPIDDINPARVQRTDRLGGLVREYRLVA